MSATYECAVCGEEATEPRCEKHHATDQEIELVAAVQAYLRRRDSIEGDERYPEQMKHWVGYMEPTKRIREALRVLGHELADQPWEVNSLAGSAHVQIAMDERALASAESETEHDDAPHQIGDVWHRALSDGTSQVLVVKYMRTPEGCTPGYDTVVGDHDLLRGRRVGDLICDLGMRRIYCAALAKKGAR